MSDNIASKNATSNTFASAGTEAPSVGLLYPGVGADDDFEFLERASDGALRLPLVRTAGGDVAHLVDELLAVGGSQNLLDGARELVAFSPDSVMWACTSGSFVYGWDGAHTQADEVAQATGLPASSTSIAFAEACRALGVGTVAVAASYPDDLAQHFKRFLGDAGVEVVSFHSNDIATAGEVGLLGKDEVIAMALDADHPDAKAILIPDTAMHSLRWIDDLERAAGKIVLTANQVTVWEGLRIAGRPLRLDGLGTLFR
ncbi:maleate cis-trans isomerase family protein [Glaciibacter superstes]|uniref:maleate cis-trans isomerase family protein n=1 Tax=Glaciibacter superstes TaxID=501023 RepID=UPI0003B4A8C7|nr:hypothetical protein [Glaciibacter superstes]